MASLRKVNQNDKNRILLSEVLPYEVPIIFSNEGFYDFISEKDNTAPDLVEQILCNPSFEIPFNYKVKKTAFAHRSLSVMHPCSQKDFISFYQKYDLLMVHLCSKSPVSLRYPSQVAGMVYEKVFSKNENHKENGVDIEVDYEENLKERIGSSSYFKYKKYDLLLKFYDSYEFIRLEKRYKCLLKFDISNCFNSIYTHSISWAVKDKMFSKSYKNRDSFEKEFDERMRNSNHGETNGILIGPEVSRIFAEIILQKIDLNAIDKLSSKGIIRREDYELRRYVDDYFVFTNDEKVANTILKVFEEELEYYKLYINKGKTENLKVPFVSGITIARMEIFKLLKEFFEYFFESFFHEDEDVGADTPIVKKVFKIRSSYTVSNKLILDLKCIVKNNNVEFESISRIAFSIVKRKLNVLYAKTDVSVYDENQLLGLSNFLLNTFDFLFFLYSMDNCVRITYVMTQIIVSTNNFLEKVSAADKHNLKKKIYDESIFLIKNIKNEERYLSVEILNLLIALKDLGDEYNLEEGILMELLDLESNDNSLCYFHFVVALYYIKDQNAYSNIKIRIEKLLVKTFLHENYIAEKAEKTLLFFDVISCPFVSEDCKNNIVETVYAKIRNRMPNETERNTVKKFIAKRNWFVDWSEKINLEYILSKKELTTPY